jgi:hypothetical protein
VTAVSRSGAPTFFAITKSSAHEPSPRMMRTKATPAAGRMLEAFAFVRYRRVHEEPVLPDCGDTECSEAQKVLGWFGGYGFGGGMGVFTQ